MSSDYGQARDSKEARRRALRWVKEVAYKVVCDFQEERIGRPIYGIFNGTCRRMIRQRLIDRIIEDRKAKDRYGFIGIGWLLTVMLAGVITWAIKRWLDRVFPIVEGK